jgi:hypothetical protein
MDMNIPISLGDKQDDETDYRDNLLVNYIMVERDIKGDQGYVMSHDGLTSFGTGYDIDRGAIYNDRINEHLRISGTRLISVDSVGVSTVIGIISGSGHAILPYSFKTQGILSGGRFWLYDGSTLVEVVDPDLGSPIDAIWINGVYLFTDGETLFHTQAASETAIDPLTFATSEFSPDRTYGLLKTKQNQAIVFNRYSTEWFSDTGSATNFRFRRINGKSIKAGIAGTNCKVELDGQIFILGGRKEESPSIHILTSGNAQTVATREIDKILEGYTESELRQTVMESRVKARSKFMIVRLLRHTLLYNHSIASKHGVKYAWTALKSSIVSDTPWRAINGIFDPRIGKWVYGDLNGSTLGALDSTTNKQYNELSENVFYTPIVKLEGFSINELEIDTVTGFNNEDVTVFCSTSRDGVSFGAEFSIAYNVKFKYAMRFIKRALGYIRHNIAFKFRVVSDGKTAFSGLRINYD